jgi:hypothetical protein
LKISDPVARQREHEVEERSKTAPKHPKTAARASRSGRRFTSIHIHNNNNNKRKNKGKMEFKFFFFFAFLFFQTEKKKKKKKNSKNVVKTWEPCFAP